MPRRGKGVPVAEGIWRYANGYRVVTKVKADGGQKEKWFKAGSDPLKLVAWRANWELERRQGKAAPVVKHSFAAAVRDYLTTIPQWVNPDAPPKERKRTRRYANADNDLSVWMPHFRDLDVNAITAQAIRTVLADWRSENFAASTINHRRQELKNLFTFLNGKAGANPVRDVPKIKESYDDARGQLPAVVEAILAEMEDGDTKKRLRVIWETALPPADLIRLQAARFHPHQKTVFVFDRKKGAGVKGGVMSLTAAGVDALSAFFDAGLEGKAFSNGSANRSFKRAVKKAKARWIGVWPAPDNLHPYDLRHSRLTEALRRSSNLQGVQRLGRHKRMETTLRYVRALEAESLKQVVEAMESERVTLPAADAKNVKIAAVSRSIDRRRSERTKP